jgi:DNA-binding MarR family transcriptional regulator
MTATTAMTFMEVVIHGGSTAQGIMSNLGLTQAATSRNTRLLSDKDGLNLIEAVESPTDARVKHFFLTGNGVRLAMKLFQILDPDALQPSIADFPTAKTLRKSRASTR